MKTYAKFAVLVVGIIAVLGWLAAGGINETKTYYKTITELRQMGDRANGQRIRVADTYRLLGEASVGWVVHNSRGGILNYGRTRRYASEQQIEALIARDGGCANPGCTAAAEWCDRHHILEWQAGGETNLDNLVLLCRYHHMRLLLQGWLIEIHDGVPWFTPPKTIDPQQRPLRNYRGLRPDPLAQLRTPTRR